jgi:hypothetical protein
MTKNDGGKARDPDDRRGGEGEDWTADTGLGWVAVTLEGTPLSHELAAAISLVLGSAAHGFLTCKGLELVPAETAAALLGVPVAHVQALAASGHLPSIPDGVGKFFEVRDIVEHRARMGEQEAAIRSV